MAELTDQRLRRRAADRLAFGGQADAGELVEQRCDGEPVLDVGPQPDVDTTDQAARRAGQQVLAVQDAALIIWWLDRMVTTAHPFVEKMTWFWHGHFATGEVAVRSAGLLARQNQTQRRLGLGSFADLVGAMTVDPAMLLWLSGDQNRAGAPNENLGRELMELFVLGVGSYTEDDVRAAARALTGWTVNKAGVTASLVRKRHDPRPGTVLGTTVSDAATLVAALVERPDAARHVVQRVWARFVSTAPPSDATLTRLVAAFGPDRDVGALMRAAAADPAFRDPASVLVKQRPSRCSSTPRRRWSSSRCCGSSG